MSELDTPHRATVQEKGYKLLKVTEQSHPLYRMFHKYDKIGINHEGSAKKDRWYLCCNGCGRSLVYDTKSYSGLRYHLKSEHEHIYEELERGSKPIRRKGNKKANKAITAATTTTIAQHHVNEDKAGGNSSSDTRFPAAATTSLLAPTVRTKAATAASALEAAERQASSFSTSSGWTIAISDAGGVPSLVKRTDGACAASYEIAVARARTAAMFGKETSELDGMMTTSSSLERQYNFVEMGAGVPLIVDGICCGAIGVCGSGERKQDAKVARAAIDALHKDSISV